MTEKEMKCYILEILEWYKENLDKALAMGISPYDAEYRINQYKAIMWEIDRLKRGETE